jgi:hypothetical protein
VLKNFIYYYSVNSISTASQPAQPYKHGEPTSTKALTFQPLDGLDPANGGFEYCTVLVLYTMNNEEFLGMKRNGAFIKKGSG